MHWLLLTLKSCDNLQAASTQEQRIIFENWLTEMASVIALGSAEKKKITKQVLVGQSKGHNKPLLTLKLPTK